eukprot:gene825-588_t
MSGPDYGSPSYWDERYAADDKCYDWYQDYSTLRDHLAPYLSPEGEFEILIPGCGNANLGADLYDAGFLNITNIDISTVVINQMTDLHRTKEEMEFSNMDARRMEFIPDQCFDLVLDKALFDAILCAEANLHDIDSLIREMWRVLKTDGHYIVISHAPPERRLPHFSRILPGVHVEISRIVKQELKDLEEEGDSKYHFMYVLTKVQV